LKNSDTTPLCAECEEKIQQADMAWKPIAASNAAIVTLETCND
jgi:hypothetical protein